MFPPRAARCNAVARPTNPPPTTARDRTAADAGASPRYPSRSPRFAANARHTPAARSRRSDAHTARAELISFPDTTRKTRSSRLRTLSGRILVIDVGRVRRTTAPRDPREPRFFRLEASLFPDDVPGLSPGIARARGPVAACVTRCLGASSPSRAIPLAVHHRARRAGGRVPGPPASSSAASCSRPPPPRVPRPRRGSRRVRRLLHGGERGRRRPTRPPRSARWRSGSG